MEGNADRLPSREECQNLVEKFAEITGTDEALAQFFLQDLSWDLEQSINAYYGNCQSISTGAAAANRDQEEDLLVTFDSNQLMLGEKSQVTTQPPKHFKLLSWNTDGLDERNLKKRTKAVVKIIEIEKPDIVFLQELTIDTYNYLEDRLPNYMCITAGTKGYFIATLLLRTTIYLDSHTILPFPGSSMERNLLLVEAHIGKVKLQLLNTHLESTAEFTNERMAQLRTCFDAVISSPSDITSILAGDLNLRDKEVDAVGLPSSLTDVWESCGKRKECCYTWDLTRNTNKEFGGQWKPRLRFDRVYLRASDPPRVSARHFGLTGLQKVAGTQSFPSDHWGLLAYFEVTNFG